MSKEKPKKPYVGFPLYAHNNGQWAAKIAGRTRFFGVWSDWKAALKRWEETRHLTTPEAFDLEDLCDLFIAHKKAEAKAGHIRSDTYKEYHRVCARALDILGRSLPIESLRAGHFQALREQLAEDIDNPVSLKNTIVKLRVLFAWAYDADHCETPLRYRQALKTPPIRLIRQARHERGKNLFTRDEITKLAAKATGWLKPAIYLGINCGLGNRDICELAWSDIQGEWVSLIRKKTAVTRKAWLWPETIAALNEWRSQSTSQWICCGSKGQQLGQGKSSATPVSKALSDIADDAGVKLDGRGFYTLRHTYRTIADGSKDTSAVRYTMGHADGSIDAAYVEGIDDERLKTVAELVRGWLVGE